MTALTTGSAARTLSMPLRSPLAKPAPTKAQALRLVPQRRSSAAKAPFVVVVVTLLVGGLLGLLLLNTLVAQGSFRLHDLAKNAKALQQKEQDLGRQVQALQAPAALAARATSLGMVPGGPPAFLRLSDGKVLGEPTAGALPAVARPAAPTVAKPAASTTWTGPKPSTKPGTAPSTKPGKTPSLKPRTVTTTSTTGAHR